MKITSIFTVVALLTGILSIFYTTPVYADKAEDKAKQYCNSQNISDEDQKSICQFGFEAGYKKTPGGVCFGEVKSFIKKKYNVTLNSVTAINRDSRAKPLYEQCRDAKVAGANQRGSDDNTTANQNFGNKKCGEVSTFFSYGCDGADNKSGDENNPIFSILLTIVAWLTAGVMVAVIGGIVYGGYLYMTAQDNASQTQKGIKIIVDAVIGLIAFGLMWTILNFIIPGGIYAG